MLFFFGSSQFKTRLNRKVITTLTINPIRRNMVISSF
ncbi:MAG: hypothetical protein RLZ47_1070, partial [Bacteroidota bacterium]